MSRKEYHDKVYELLTVGGFNQIIDGDPKEAYKNKVNTTLGKRSYLNPTN